MSVQDREVHGQSLLIEAHGHPSRITRLHLVDERLQLDQQGPCAFPGHGRHATRGVELAPLQEDGRGVSNLLHALFGHREHAQFVHRTEAVFDSSQRAVAAARRTVQHHEAVDHVFEHFGSRQVAVLGDVADQHHDGTGRFSQPGEVCGRLAHLAHAARCAVDAGELQHLNRIQYQQARSLIVDEIGNELCAGFRQDLQAFDGKLQAPGTHGELLQRFFSADVQHRHALGHRGGDLQKQCAFTGPGITPHQHHGTRHQPTAQHTIEFGKAGR